MLRLFAAILIVAASLPAQAQNETQALQEKIDALTQDLGALESEVTTLRGLVEDLAAAGIQAKFPRHGLVKLNWLPDPYAVECNTVQDTPVTCDPTANVYDADEDLVVWDAGVCDNGTLTLEADVPTYTPPAGFTGLDNCTADVRDDGQYALDVAITVTVAAP